MKHKFMKYKLLAAVCVCVVCFSTADAQQSKGTDSQKDRVRDAGSDREAGNNGNKTDVGTGRGFDFGRGKTRSVPALANPYRIRARRDVILQNVGDLITERKMILDEAGTRPDLNIVVTQPYTFSKGASLTETDLSRYSSNFDFSAPGGWTRGRYTMRIELIPIDGTTTDVSVSARIEGRRDSVVSTEWVTLISSGLAEQEFLIGLAERFGIAPVAPQAP